MKSIVKKLVIGCLLAAGLLALGPQVRPRLERMFTAPEVEIKPVLPPPGVRHLEQVEDLVFEMTNRVRQEHGLAPLAKDGELRQVARAYSNDMLVRRFFDHTNPDGVSFDERISDHYPHWVLVIGENLWSAYGYNPARAQQLAKEIVADWLSSPGHRENLLNPGFTHLGVGISAGRGRIRATQEFVTRPRFFSVQSSKFKVQS